MRWMSSLLTGIVVLLVCQSPARAFCGFYAGKADASLFNEASQVILVRDGNRTVISMQNDYSGPLTQFALIVPTPTVLQKGQVRIADRQSFDRLDAYSSPRLAEYFDANPCTFNLAWGEPNRPPRMLLFAPTAASAAAVNADSAVRAKALGVTVEASYTLGEYDIVSLSATQSDGLETWLHENGYTIPVGASAALKPYINQGMKFFVAKVNLEEQQKTGFSRLRPLQFAYESDKFMLPIRLGMLNAPADKPQDLIVYMLTRRGRVETSNYRTVKLPANLNLPYFVKPKFQDFYKAMFATELQKEDQRVVFTEYFWNMAWCDPCAAQPLSRDELRNAGVFWVDGDADANFNVMTSPPGTKLPGGTNVRPYGAEPVQLTRLHVRYTPKTFPEDLMFTETGDQQNWQARYIIQNPYQGTPAACEASLAQTQCEAVCRPRVDRVATSTPGPDEHRTLFLERDPASLMRDCVSACVTAKQNALEQALQYYQSDLPRRIAAEKETLARLTGWTGGDIDALPDARRYASLESGSALQSSPWWQQLFDRAGAAR